MKIYFPPYTFIMERNKEWSNDEMLMLIDLYKEKPCLWDPTNKEYKLKTKRSDCWLEIASIFNCDVTMVRKKMESLLTSFRRERQRCEETKKSGVGLDEIYTSTWFAFEKMKFLLDKFSPRPTQDTMDDSNETQDNIISRDSDDSAPSTNRILKPPNILKQGKNNIFDQRAEEAYNNMKEAVRRRNERDQSTTFGEHVANKHRSYSSRTKCIVEHFIANILFEADIGKYENYPFISPTSNYSQEPYYICQSPAHSDSTTPTSPFPVHQPPLRTRTTTLPSVPFSVHQSPSSTPTPTLPSISIQTSTLSSPSQSQSQVSRTQILNLPANQSVSSTPLPNSQSLLKQYGQEPQLVKNSKPTVSRGSGPKKVKVLRPLIIKRSKNNLQNIPPNEQHLLPEEKYISSEEQTIVPRSDPSFIHDDFADVSQQENTDHLVSFINNYIPE